MFICSLHYDSIIRGQRMIDGRWHHRVNWGSDIDESHSDRKKKRKVHLFWSLVNCGKKIGNVQKAGGEICVLMTFLSWVKEGRNQVGFMESQGNGTPLQYSCLEKSHGWKSLVGCSPWGRWGSNTTEQLHFHFSLACIGEGNGNPLQCSCLENLRDRGAWWAAVYGVTQSWTWLKWLSSSSMESQNQRVIVHFHLGFQEETNL